MKKKFFNILRFLFFLSLGVVLFWLAIKDTPLKMIIEELKKANYYWIGLSVIIMVYSHWIRAIRWNLLINTMNYHPKAVTTFYSVLVGYFANLAVPRLGEVTRCGVLSKHDKIPLNSIIGTVIIERAFDMICLFIIIIITILVQIDFLGAFLYKHIISPVDSKFSNNSSALWLLGIIILLFLLTIFLLYKYLRPRIRHKKIYIKIKELILGFWAGIISIKQLKTKKRFVFYSFFLWFLYMLTMYFTFKAINETASLTIMDAVTLLAMGSIGVLAPTPGGIGAYQYMVGITLTGLYLIEKVPAYSYANIIYFSQWIMIVILGGLAWVLLIISQRKHSK